MALAAADMINDGSIRNILNNPQTLPQVTAELDRKLGL